MTKWCLEGVGRVTGVMGGWGHHGGWRVWVGSFGGGGIVSNVSMLPDKHKLAWLPCTF